MYYRRHKNGDRLQAAGLCKFCGSANFAVVIFRVNCITAQPAQPHNKSAVPQLPKPFKMLSSFVKQSLNSQSMSDIGNNDFGRIISKEDIIGMDH